MKTIKILIIVIILFTVELIQAQDIHFSQYYNTPTFFNPATAGAFNGDHRVSLHYRSQWSGIGSGNKTYGLSYDASLKGKNSRKDNFFGLGLTAYGDNSGENKLKETAVNGLISYNIKVSGSSFFTLGVDAGFNQYAINSSSGIWDAQYDGVAYNPNLPSGEAVNPNGFSAFNLGSGVLWSFASGNASATIKDRKNIQIGASFFHLIPSTYSFINNTNESQDFKYIIHGNSLFDIANTNVSLQPSFLFQKQGPSNEIVVGTLIRYQTKEASRYTGLMNQSAFYIGAYYRVGDAFIPAIQFEKSYFLLGLSYDLNLSEFTTATNGNGGFEITLRFITPSQLRTHKSSARFM